MASYIVVVCSKCGMFLMAKTEQKTRTCPYCGSKVYLDKAKKLASAESVYQASKILRSFKGALVIKRKSQSPKTSLR